MNTAVFYYGYKDLQVDRILATLSTSIEIASLARVSGEMVGEGLLGFPFNSGFIPPVPMGTRLVVIQ